MHSMAASRHSFMARWAASTALRERLALHRLREQPLEERAWQKERQPFPLWSLQILSPLALRDLAQQREQQLTWRRAQTHLQAAQPVSRRLQA
jgi:hypothetical protein